MLCRQYFLGLNMSDVCIQRKIIGNVFYSTFTSVFTNSCHVFFKHF